MSEPIQTPPTSSNPNVQVSADRPRNRTEAAGIPELTPLATPLVTSLPTPDKQPDSLFMKNKCFEDMTQQPRFQGLNPPSPEDLVFLSSLLAGTAKQSKAIIEKGLNQLGYQVIQWIENKSRGVFGYVIAPTTPPQHTLIVFGGTQDFQGVLTDFQFITKRGDGRDTTGLLSFPGLNFKGWMHSGFYDSYYSISGSLESTLSDLHLQMKNAEHSKLFFAGHSYGGALATLAAARAAQAKLNVGYLFTEGQPRIGDSQFAAHLEELLSTNYYRIQNEDDIVPHLAPTSEAARSFSFLAATLSPTRDLPGLGFASEQSLRITKFTHAAPLLRLFSEKVQLPRNQVPSFSKPYFQDSDALNLVIENRSDAESDQAFWDQIKTSRKTLADLSSSKEISDHDASSYLCRLVYYWTLSNKARHLKNHMPSR